jgi:hypothetical protein
MNYLSHARHHLEGDPWVLAGTAVPDWLGAVDRRARVDLERAKAMATHDDYAGRIARGVVEHFEDDAWFHITETFDEVTTTLTRNIRAAYPEQRRLRASFLGHVLMEMLLDAWLDEERPGSMDAYYEALGRIDDELVADTVGRLLPRAPPKLAPLIGLFRRARFLHGYREDEALVRRLNGLMGRVRLPRLPDGFVSLLPEARALVREQGEALLAKPS